MFRHVWGQIFFCSIFRQCSKRGSISVTANYHWNCPFPIVRKNARNFLCFPLFRKKFACFFCLICFKMAGVSLVLTQFYRTITRLSAWKILLKASLLYLEKRCRCCFFWTKYTEVTYKKSTQPAHQKRGREIDLLPTLGWICTKKAAAWAQLMYLALVFPPLFS